MHSTFWVVGGVGGWWVVGGGLGKVGWVVSVWVRSVGLSWAGFVELGSVGWVPESGVRGHHINSKYAQISPLKKKRNQNVFYTKYLSKLQRDD